MKVKDLIPNPEIVFVINARDRSHWVWVTDKLDKSKRIRLPMHQSDFHIDMDIKPVLYHPLTGRMFIINIDTEKLYGGELPIVFIGE